MSRVRHLVQAAVFALALPAMAHADVQTRPTRDVVVTYRVDGPATTLVPGGLQGPVRLSWDAGGQRLRAEAEGHAQVVLLDLRTDTGQAFDTALRIALPVKVRPSDLRPLTLDGARLTPVGRDQAAGLPCLSYRVVLPGDAPPATVCLSADGIPLMGSGVVRGRPGHFVATAVRYGRLPDSLFTVPPGFVDLSHGDSLGAMRGILDRLRSEP